MLYNDSGRPGQAGLCKNHDRSWSAVNHITQGGLRKDADAIIASSLNAVLPDEAVRRALKAFAPKGGRVLLVAAGKAAWQMAHAAVEALGRVDGGVVVTKYKHVRGEILGVNCYEAGHPVPDENSFAATEKALELVRGLAELNDQGYILTDRSQKTTADGLYAAGDVCVKPLRQVVTAVGDGALAATELEHLCAAMQEKTGIHPKAPVSRAEETAVSTETNSTLFTGGMPAQLHTVFARMAAPLVLRLYLDETPLSAELKQYMEELAAQSSKLTAEIGTAEEMEHLPCVRVCRPDGSWTGLAFHGVPGGHEFTSFVLGLYNAAGPGQALDEDTRAAIQSVQKPIKLEILVSLSCTMCPELVTAAQRIAAENPHITAQVYDLNHFPDLRERYQVMSVPCLVINDGAQVSFGKKNIRQLLELLT